MASSSVADAISFAAKQYAIYGYFTILISGVIGNICNILVLSCFKLFRRNQCAFYLIVQSITDCSLLLIVLPFRITEIAFAYDTTRASLVWCKLKAMISYTLALHSFSSICFAAIDQYLSTNYHAWLKQMSTLKLAHRLVYSAMVVLILYNSIFLIFFEIQSSSGCNIYNAAFALYFSFGHYIVLSGFLPILVSSVFSLLAYSNVRRIIQRRIPVVRRKLEKQLTAMVLAKVAFLVATILPSISFRIYILNVTVSSSETIRIAINQLISNISYALFYINSAGTFYVFLLVSPRFRRQVKHTFVLVKNLGLSCCQQRQRNNQIAPAAAERSEFE